MKIFTAETYEDMSKLAVSDVIELLKSTRHPLLCTASGDSPAGLYKEMIQQLTNKQADILNWYFAGLDEWAGMNETDEGSCRYHLNKQLYFPLQITNDRICFFDGREKNLEAECERVENFINTNGGIDVAVIGLGLNGHVGMNEPGTSPALRSHVAAIDPETQKAGQKYFKEPKEISKGLTLGLANLIEARHIVLIVSGTHKASIVQKLVEGEISEQLPASLLRCHNNFTIYLDKEASSMLHSI